MVTLGWQPFEEDSNIEGMEAFLENDSALDVIRYVDSDEWHWLYRKWVEQDEQYEIYASYDNELSYGDAESAFETLMEFAKAAFPI